MTFIKSSTMPFGAARQMHAGASAAPLPYPSTWSTVEDHELPLLDQRLVARMRFGEKRAALDRLEAMVGERLTRRSIAHSAAATALIREGAGLDEREADAESRFATGMSWWPNFAELSVFAGRRRRIETWRNALVMHTLALEVLRLLAQAIAREADDTPAPDAAQPLADPLLGALAALFGGFNTAYLIPEHAYQEQLLSAAAWLSWRIEGLSAPLPAMAAVRLAEMGASDGLVDRDDDPGIVLALGLRLARLTPNTVECRGSDAWPARRLGTAISVGAAEASLCRRLLLAIQCKTLPGV